MTTDPELLRGLEAAVAVTPDNVALRLHLATLLLADGQAAAALGHCETILRSERVSPEARELAERARAQMGISTTEGEAEPSREALPVGGPVPPPLDELFEIVRPDVTLADVAGMEQVKDRLRVSFLEPMRNEELRRMYGSSLRGGMLLFGPPGCGKTFVARALAGELGVYFIPVALTDVLDMWIGNSEKNLRALFDTARAMAPAVIFIDELDALGHKRSRFGAAGGARNVVNQLLTELDGVDQSNEGVFVLAATNQPWDIDSALRRPGRLDRSLVVLPPDEPAREAILGLHLRERPVGTVNLRQLASRTALYSGADLAHVCETAANRALSESVRSGTPRPISQSDLEAAVGDVQPSTREWLRTAKGYAQFADDSATYGELLDFIRRHRI